MVIIAQLMVKMDREASQRKMTEQRRSENDAIRARNRVKLDKKARKEERERWKGLSPSKSWTAGGRREKGTSLH